MLSVIFSYAIYTVGSLTIGLGILIGTLSAWERVQIKIKKGKDPKLNIKHINRLIRKIEREGWKVDIENCTIKGNPDFVPVNMSVSQVRLSKTRRTVLGVELDENNNVVKSAD